MAEEYVDCGYDGRAPPRLTLDQMIAELPQLRRRGAVVMVLSDGDIEMK